jgi:hypothetical protein
MQIGQKIKARLEQMKALRGKSEHVWRACYEVTHPERMEGLGSAGMDASEAQQKKAELLDNTATDGVRLLASNVMGGMTPANAIWLAFDVTDETDDERRWLDHAAMEVWQAIHQSNYDSQKYEALVDSLIAGWMVLFIDEDAATGRPVFYQFPLGQCFIGCSKAGGPVDTLYRCFTLTAEQALNEYGDKVSAKVREEAIDPAKSTTPHVFIHAIYPRTEASKQARMARNLPFASIHVEVSTELPVRESGFHEQPFTAPRWMVLPDSPYAIGLVSNALGNIRELNELLRLEKAALARAAAGVYVAVDDGVLNPRGFRVRGGSVIVANSIDSIKELPSGADFNVTFSKSDQMRSEIRRLLLADQLTRREGPPVTAAQVHVEVALIRQLLGPLYGRFQSEDLKITADRVFGMMYRRGRPEIGGAPGPVLIDDAPESLGGEVFAIRYLSPLARAQKMDEVTAIERTAAFAGQLAEMGMSEALDLIDSDESIRIAADALGTPSKALRDTKALAAYRKGRAEAQEQAAQQAQAQQVQTMAVDAALKQPAAA